jgi:hypothetical protein
LTPRFFGQATGASGVEVAVGSGVSVGTGVNVDIANVGNGEGSITGAGKGATSDQLQASAARINAERGRVHPNFVAGFMVPPCGIRTIQVPESHLAQDPGSGISMPSIALSGFEIHPF